MVTLVFTNAFRRLQTRKMDVTVRLRMLTNMKYTDAQDNSYDLTNIITCHFPVNICHTPWPDQYDSSSAIR